MHLKTQWNIWRNSKVQSIFFKQCKTSGFKEHVFNHFCTLQIITKCSIKLECNSTITLTNMNTNMCIFLPLWWQMSCWLGVQLRWQKQDQVTATAGSLYLYPDGERLLCASHFFMMPALIGHASMIKRGREGEWKKRLTDQFQSFCFFLWKLLTVNVLLQEVVTSYFMSSE